MLGTVHSRMRGEVNTLSRRAALRTMIGGGVAGGAVSTIELAAAQETRTHTIDMTDGLVFDPDEMSIAPGDTVVWQNVGNVGHSVTAYEDQIPGEADYFASGGFDGEQAARGGYPSQGDIVGGESFEHTFEVEGEYEYFCIPHESVGMLGTITVGADAGSDGNGGIPIPEVPESARWLGVAGTIGILLVIGLSYFFGKYGDDYGPPEE